MKYTTDTKLPLHNNTYDFVGKTEESSPMYTISSFSSDTTLQSNPMSNISKSFSSSSLRRIGIIKLLIMAIVLPTMLLTIVNPMWICIFMKYPHVHRIPIKTPANVEVPQGGDRPQPHIHTEYKGGIQVTKETFDIIVESEDGQRLEELETTITVIENIPPDSENQHYEYDTNKKETTNATPVTSNNESTIDRIRERLFRDSSSCAYFALSVILLCAAVICSIVYVSSGDEKMYDPVNDAENHYVRVDCNDDDNKTNKSEKSKENNAENKTVNQNACITECTQV